MLVRSLSGKAIAVRRVTENQGKRTAWLLAHVPMDRAILKKWLRAGFIESQTLWPTEAGTPQGGIISPTLANLALDGLEPELRRCFQQPDKVHLARYCDDFIISGRSKELLENEVMPLVV